MYKARVFKKRLLSIALYCDKIKPTYSELVVFCVIVLGLDNRKTKRGIDRAVEYSIIDFVSYPIGHYEALTTDLTEISEIVDKDILRKKQNAT